MDKKSLSEADICLKFITPALVAGRNTQIWCPGVIGQAAAGRVGAGTSSCTSTPSAKHTPGQVITLRYTLNRFLQFEAESATTGNRASFNYKIEK